MTENEKLPFKKQWKKKYLKQLCGFANSHGGSIYIEDSAAKDPSLTTAVLAESIRKKVEKELGIPVMICETELQGVRCLEIAAAPSMRPVAYDGEYYGEGPKGIKKLEGESLVRMISEKFDALAAAGKKNVTAVKKKKTERKKKPETAVAEKAVAEKTVAEKAVAKKTVAEKTMVEAAVNKTAETHQFSRADAMEKKLLALFIEDPYMKQEKAAEILGISLRTVKRIVRALTDSKRLIRAGGRRYGHWEIPKED